MGYLQDIELLIANTYPNNEVKGSGDYWYQPEAGIEVNTDVWSDEDGGGWVIKNSLNITANNQLIFTNTEEEIANFDCEEYKILVLQKREEYYKRMLETLIDLGY